MTAPNSQGTLENHGSGGIRCSVHRCEGLCSGLPECPNHGFMLIGPDLNSVIGIEAELQPSTKPLPENRNGGSHK